MKNKILYITLVIALFFAVSPANLYSQVGFTHDEAGNRTSRFIIPAGLKSAEEIDESIPDEFPLYGDIKVLVYPNPTAGLVSMEIQGIENEAALNIEVKVYTSNGRLILDRTHNSRSFEIDITNNAPGMYLFDLYVNGNKQIFTIIKE